MLRARGVCFSTSSRAIVLPEADMGMSRKQAMRNKSLTDMNDYVPNPSDEVDSKPAISSTAKHALEEIKRQTGILGKLLLDHELQQAEAVRYKDLQEQYTELAAMNTEMGMWLDMIKTALGHYDEGELSARRFANEIDAAIKGWEGK